MKLFWLFAMIAAALIPLAANAAAGPWDQPAAALADQIASLLGPGQASLNIRNLSTITASDLPVIRNLVEQDLRTHNITLSGAESANAIHITLSETDHTYLWVAEIAEGNQHRVVMVRSDRQPLGAASDEYRIILRKEYYLGRSELSGRQAVSSNDPVLATAETVRELIVLRAATASFYQRTPSGWQFEKTIELGPAVPASRDPRGLLRVSTEGNTFTAYLPGVECSGVYGAPESAVGSPANAWSIHCHTSDDPWPIIAAQTSDGVLNVKAFYNAGRNYFTGVVAPSVGADLPPFYSAAVLPRPVRPALLIGGIDGKVQIVENSAAKLATGARDWGSDFAVLDPGCGSGAQIIASQSGAAAGDSLRAYEMPAQEAVASSAPLSMGGSIRALWPALDGKSIFAVVLTSLDEYEVDRVTAHCD